MRARLLLVACLPLLACGSGTPAPLDAQGAVCAFCRMKVSDATLAAQLAAPGEESRFFDDIGCLAAYLADHGALPDGAAAYVADHRTKNWVAADLAQYTRVPGLETPMGSHLIAHADAASRVADPRAARGSPTPVADIFGNRLQAGARR